MPKPILHAITKRIVNPKKLLKSKWTAAKPINKEKHFMVTQFVMPEIADSPIKFVVLEAVFSKRTQIIPWQTLNDADQWLQGWV